MKSLFKIAALVAFTATCFTAKAVPLDFGDDLEAGELLGYVAGNVGNTETQIANVINGIASTSFVAADIFKFDPTQVEDQFYVPSGYDYLLVQYDGPNGGSAVFGLWGSDAWVPYDSAPLWGTGDQYGASHFALAGPSTTNVPDGGTTAALLGLGLVAMSMIARRRAA